MDDQTRHRVEEEWIQENFILDMLLPSLALCMHCNLRSLCYPSKKPKEINGDEGTTIKGFRVRSWYTTDWLLLPFNILAILFSKTSLEMIALFKTATSISSSHPSSHDFLFYYFPFVWLGLLLDFRPKRKTFSLSFFLHDFFRINSFHSIHGCTQSCNVSSPSQSLYVYALHHQQQGPKWQRSVKTMRWKDVMVSKMKHNNNKKSREGINSHRRKRGVCEQEGTSTSS